MTSLKDVWEKYIQRLKINNYIIFALVLGVLQFLVYFSGYDHLLTWGPFVAHHFIELPAFYVFGFGFSVLLLEMKFSSLQAQIINLFFFILTLIPFFGGSFNGILASFIVSNPWLIGFYVHRLTSSRTI